MAHSLATVITQVETQLSDTQNLIWSESSLTEAIRSALADISKANGAALFLASLDTALTTTIDDQDIHILISGAVAYAVRFRVMGRFEEATPEDLQPEQMAKWATQTMDKFQQDLYMFKLDKFQQSIDHPYSPWDWEEGDEFS